MSKKSKNKAIAIFQGSQIRRHWDDEKELWYFSIVDVIATLTEQPDHKRAQSYWTTLKNRLKAEGSEVVTKCDQLKIQAADGKFYLTDVADTEVMLRLIQSVPSKNAEPFKLWLARIGYERLEETADPELAINRARKGEDRLDNPDTLYKTEIAKEWAKLSKEKLYFFLVHNGNVDEVLSELKQL